MSAFMQRTIHPNTQETEVALWMDDYFGRHIYGVKFADGKIFHEDRCEVADSYCEDIQIEPFEDVPHPVELVSIVKDNNTSEISLFISDRIKELTPYQRKQFLEALASLAHNSGYTLQETMYSTPLPPVDIS